MKCPKCGFLGFDSGDRCKNCGYDFSLAAGGAAARGRPSHDLTPGDLPLFRGDVPLPPPRAPLSVRKASPTPARVRARPPASSAGVTPSPAVESPAGRTAAGEEPAPFPAAAPAAAEHDAAPAGRRAAAAGIDACLLMLVNLAVVHFTLAVCGLTFADVSLLPRAPMLAFLLLLNTGYVVLFTGLLGQTFGKMAAGIEVVPDGREPMTLRRSAWRAAALAAAVLPAGVGWLAGLIGDRRGVHDRLAGTRVIRVAGA